MQNKSWEGVPGSLTWKLKQYFGTLIKYPLDFLSQSKQLKKNITCHLFVITTGTAHTASTELCYGSRMGHILHTHQKRIHLSREIVTKEREEERKRKGRKEEDRCVFKGSIRIDCSALAPED